MWKTTGRRIAVLAVALVYAGCGGADGSGQIESTSTSIATTSTTDSVPTVTPASSAPPATADSTLPDTSEPDAPDVVLPSVISLAFGEGVEMIPGDVDREPVGPTSLTAHRNTVTIADPVGGRLLRHDGASWTAIDVRALGVDNTTFLATTPTDYVVVEISNAPPRQRIHLVDRQTGELTSTTDLEPGFRLEDGLSDVGVHDGEIYLEFAGGARYARWTPASGLEATDLMIDGIAIESQAPDLSIGGTVVQADLSGDLGGLRYIAHLPDGSHVLLREDVTSLDPVVRVVTTVEWYSPSLEHIGTAPMPALEDQFIPVAPDIAVDGDGRVWALTTTDTELRVVLITPRDVTADSSGG